MRRHAVRNGPENTRSKMAEETRSTPPVFVTQKKMIPQNTMNWLLQIYNPDFSTSLYVRCSADNGGCKTEQWMPGWLTQVAYHSHKKKI